MYDTNISRNNLFTNIMTLYCNSKVICVTWGHATLFLFQPCFGEKASSVLCGSRDHVNSHEDATTRVLDPVCGTTEVCQQWASWGVAVSNINIVTAAVLLAIRNVNEHEFYNYPVACSPHKYEIVEFGEIKLHRKLLTANLFRFTWLKELSTRSNGVFCIS